MNEEDELLTCPFDVSHRILKSRMAVHLTRCEKNYPTIKLEKCPYNILHRVKPLEFQHHLATCKDRGSAKDMFCHTESSRQLDIVTITETTSIQNNVPITENWDMDPEPVQSYDPTKQIERSNILQIKVLASKAEKKKFKQKERERHAAFSNDTNASKQNTQTIKSKDELETPLRLPRHLPQALTQNKMKSDSNGIVSDNNKEKHVKKNASEDSINKKPNGEILKESNYLDEDLITFTKKCIISNDTLNSESDNVETTLNGTTETCENMATNSPRGLQRDNDKRCSAGRGVSRVFEAYKKSGLSADDFKTYFMNPENDIDSLMKVTSETHDYTGVFFGYTEESDLDMQDLEDELSSIGGFETN